MKSIINGIEEIWIKIKEDFENFIDKSIEENILD